MYRTREWATEVGYALSHAHTRLTDTVTAYCTLTLYIIDDSLFAYLCAFWWLTFFSLCSVSFTSSQNSFQCFSPSLKAHHDCIVTTCYTGHFIMFSMIINFYNQKTKGPILMELFTATGKMKKFLFTARYVRCVHHGWHGRHWYDIQVLATRINMAPMFFTVSVSVKCFYHTRMVLSVGGCFAYFAPNGPLRNLHEVHFVQ